jgi:hypothetical protein
LFSTQLLRPALPRHKRLEGSVRRPMKGEASWSSRSHPDNLCARQHTDIRAGGRGKWHH